MRIPPARSLFPENFWTRRYRTAFPAEWDGCHLVFKEFLAKGEDFGSNNVFTTLKHPPPGWGLGFGGMASDWKDESLVLLGLDAWNEYFKDKGVTLANACFSMLADVRALYVDPESTYRITTAGRFMSFALRWADTAFQKLTTTHTYASALMCSDASKDTLEDLVLPWRAFMVMVPNGLLRVRVNAGGYNGNPKPARDIDLDRILVSTEEDGSCTFVIYSNTVPTDPDDPVVWSVSYRGTSVADVLFEIAEHYVGEDSNGEEPIERDLLNRVLRLAKRLVTGLLFAMQHIDNFRTRTMPARLSKRTRSVEAPEHRVTTIGKPLNIDCREHVRAFLGDRPRRKEAAPASVQSLVRGHYKRQVIGVGRKGRKVILIEPYWRGDEDAPILTRPKKIG